MKEKLATKTRTITACFVVACLYLGSPSSPLSDNTLQTGLIAPLPVITGAEEELLDQIFEEEKSDLICRFLKNRKMKV